MVKEHDEIDMVNHPQHYNRDGAMECIDEMIAIFGKTAVKHFCLLNVWKYRKRAVFKNGAEDMKKADWYLTKAKEIKKHLGCDRKDVRLNGKKAIIFIK